MEKKRLLFLRRVIVAGFIVWLGQSAWAQDDGFEWYVSYPDSAEVALDLAHLRSLKFSYSERTMTANYRDGSSFTHDYTQMGKMYFAAASGIGEMSVSEAARYTLDGTMLTLHDDVQDAVLYRLDGTMVMEITDRVVSLDALPAGIYILRVDNQIVKLCVR